MRGMLRPECLVCSDNIPNRICYRCIEPEVRKWLSSRNPAYTGSVRQAGILMGSYYHDGTDCILCGGNLNVCSKCYCMQVHKALRGDAVLASEFLDFAARKGFMLSSIRGVLNLGR